MGMFNLLETMVWSNAEAKPSLQSQDPLERLGRGWTSPEVEQEERGGPQLCTRRCHMLPMREPHSVLTKASQHDPPSSGQPVPASSLFSKEERLPSVRRGSSRCVVWRITTAVDVQLKRSEKACQDR